MSRLEEIQNEIATKKGFEDFNHLLENTHEMELIKSYFNRASVRYAREVAQASTDREDEMREMLERAKTELYNADNLLASEIREFLESLKQEK